MIELGVILSIMLLGICFGVIEKNQKVGTQKQRNDIRLWHWLKGAFQVVILATLSFALYGWSFKSLCFTITLLAITAVVFNFTINTVKKKPLLYLGSKGLEGVFKSIPIVYYVLLTCIIAVYYLFIKTI